MIRAAMSTAHALAELERSPELFDHIAHLQRVAEEEQRRRTQFYNDLDEDTKAEFINGKIVTHSPARLEHLEAVFSIANLLGNFARHGRHGTVYPENCLVRCQRNDYQPDICFFSAAKEAEFKPGQLLYPPPDLVVEILSPSTRNNDRTLKLGDYARHEIAEYWIVDADERMIEQYVLPSGAREYELKTRLTEGGSITSVTLKGFGVPVRAFFDAGENQRTLLSILQRE